MRTDICCGGGFFGSVHAAISRIPEGVMLGV
jgi:hypothetical protein